MPVGVRTSTSQRLSPSTETSSVTESKPATAALLVSEGRTKETVVQIAWQYPEFRWVSTLTIAVLSAPV